MLDPKLIREDTERVRNAVRVKRVGSQETVDGWLKADTDRRAAQARADSLRAEQGRIGGEVGKLKGRLKGGTSPELEALLARAAELKTQYEQAVEIQNHNSQVADGLMLQLPLPPDPSWPVGADDRENVEVRKWSDPSVPVRRMSEGLKSHIEICESLGLVDFQRGVKIAGSRSYVLRGVGAQLYHAVLRFAMDVLQSRGYEPYVVPVLVTEACMTGTGFFPGARDQAYITQDGNVLVGTSEVPLASFYADEILDESILPARMCAVSTCFRREAGAAGRDTAGLYRVHQFDKVEQVVVHRADDAEHIAIHEEIIANSEYLLQSLKIPYRVMQVCTGDMGQGKWRMYDIESWMPSRDAYGETHSGSALQDFQARRLNIRYRRPGEKQPTFCYTLNNTAAACPRLLIAILENYQNADGSVTVPEALRPYMSGLERIA
jgi:seryl-tRNA synthetase